jgi:hypothetical protein
MTLSLIRRLVKGTALTKEEHDQNLSDIQTDVNAATSDLTTKAPLASPNFQDVPTTPTASPGTNTNQVASCAYVENAFSEAGGVPTSRTITAGSGLSGGGSLAADRTLAVDINGLTADASPNGAADYVMTYDASAAGLKKVLLNNLPGGGGGGSVDFSDVGDVLTAAVGDGSDEGPAIETALEGLTSGQTYKLKPGVTYTVGTITLTGLSNIRLWGGDSAADGRGNAKLKLKAYNGATSASRAQCPLVLYKCSNITIEGVDLDGSRGEHTGFDGTDAVHYQFSNGSMNGLTLVSCADIVLRRVAGVNCNTDGLFTVGARTWSPYTAGDSSPPNRRIRAYECAWNRNGRNGWSFVATRDVLMVDPQFCDNGDLTAQPEGPGVGVDAEMDGGEEDASADGTFQMAERIHLVRPVLARNGSTGLIWSNRAGSKSTRLVIEHPKCWGNGRFIDANFNSYDIQIYGTPEETGTVVSAESFGVYITGGECRSLGIYVGTFSSTTTRMERFQCTVEGVQLGGAAQLVARQGRGIVKFKGNEWDRVRVVISSVLTTPPTITTHGQLYIVPSGATGAWSGKTGFYAIANLDAGVWGFSPPVDGEVVYSLDVGAGANGWRVYHEKPAGAHVYGSAASAGWEELLLVLSSSDAIKVQNWWAGRIEIDGNHIVSTGPNNSGVFLTASSTCATDVLITRNVVENTTRKLLSTAFATGETGHRGIRSDGDFRYVDIFHNYLLNCDKGIELSGTFTRITTDINTHENCNTQQTIAAGMTISVRGDDRFITSSRDADMPAAQLT